MEKVKQAVGHAFSYTLLYGGKGPTQQTRPRAQMEARSLQDYHCLRPAARGQTYLWELRLGLQSIGLFLGLRRN